MIVDYLETAV